MRNFDVPTYPRLGHFFSLVFFVRSRKLSSRKDDQVRPKSNIPDFSILLGKIVYFPPSIPSSLPPSLLLPILPSPPLKSNAKHKIPKQKTNRKIKKADMFPSGASGWTWRPAFRPFGRICRRENRRWYPSRNCSSSRWRRRWQTDNWWPVNVLVDCVCR